MHAKLLHDALNRLEITFVGGLQNRWNKVRHHLRNTAQKEKATKIFIIIASFSIVGAEGFSPLPSACKADSLNATNKF